MTPANLETLVRQAQQDMAERAVDPERIRAVLPARRARMVRHRRTGALLTITAAAAVVLAIAIPLAFLSPAGDQPLPPQPAGPPGISQPVPMLYVPTWLPEGMVERERSTSLGQVGSDQFAGVVRTWIAWPFEHPEFGSSQGPRLVLAIIPTGRGQQPGDNIGEVVDINGKSGRYNPETDTVTWRPDGTAVLVLRGGKGDREEILRVARSVQPDPGQLRSPLQFGWLPEGIEMQHLGYRGNSRDHWMAQLLSSRADTTYWVWTVMPLPETTPPDNERGRWMTASVGTVTWAPEGGEALTVRDRPARMVSDPESPDRWYLVVDLGGGLELNVTGYLGGPNPLTKEDLIRTAEHVEIDPAPDLDWFGRGA